MYGLDVRMGPAVYKAVYDSCIVSGAVGPEALASKLGLRISNQSVGSSDVLYSQRATRPT